LETALDLVFEALDEILESRNCIAGFQKIFQEDDDPPIYHMGEAPIDGGKVVVCQR